jgi:signal transduction histidine kinase/ActR/RegA family two-component response regulator
MMKQLQAGWEARGARTHAGNLSVGRSLLSQLQASANGERVIVTWTGTPGEVQEIVEANDRMSFLLALSTELARIRSPQELVCTAMARLRERLGATRATLVELDDASQQAIVLRESGSQESGAGHIEISSLSLRPFAELAAESVGGAATLITDARADPRAARLYGAWYGLHGVGAILSVPLLDNGKVVALLSVVGNAPRSWSVSDVSLTRSVVDIVWPALEKARTERRVTVSEERLRLAHAVAQIGTWDWDPETRQMFFSAECGDILGIDGEGQHAHGTWQANVDAQQLATVLGMLEECTTCGTCELEYRYRHPQRGPRWIYSKAGLVEHAGHRHVVGIVLDVTVRRQAEEALKEVNQRKDEFLAMLAHELRNPLAPIRNAAQLLNVHSPGRPEVEWARAVIERQTKHLVRLVDDLLDVSRMVRGQITLQKKKVDLAEIVQTAVETSRPLIRLRKHHLNVQLPERPVRLDADLTRIAQVLSNLLNNAAKYTDDGGQIQLDATPESGFVAIRVRDTGLGIAPGLLPHVFDLFTQADRTLDRAEGGLGIGLTLVKRLVEMHGGRVEARSEGLGRGAEFIVWLPVIESEHDGVAEPMVQAAATPSANGAQSLRILIVDDNVDAADSIAMLLGMEGHQTRTVNTARAALLAVPDFEPDVVLLDIGLPEMDGYEVARRLRSHNGRHDIRLVAVTGYGQPGDRKRSQAAGFDEHLVKPVEPALLNELLRRVRPSSAE